MKQHIRLIILISFLVIFLNNLPLVYGLFSSPDGYEFLGRKNINSQDLYTYVSFIEQGKQGRVIFENLFMSEPQAPSLFRPTYILIGKMAWLLGIPSIWAYHLARIFLTSVFLFVLYKFLTRFFDSQKISIAYAIVLFSSGVGALFSAWSNSTDLWVPESITFLALSEAPHFVLSQILMLAGFIWFMKGLETKAKRWYFLSGLSFLWLSFEHPFNLPVVGLALIVLSVWLFRLKKFRVSDFVGLFIIGTFCILGGLYQVYEINQNEVLRSWARQNILISPAYLDWIFGFGGLLVLGLFGLEKFLKEEKNYQLLAVSWVVSTFVLLYIPLFFQRRFIEGVHIPISIMAVYGVFFLGKYFSKFVVKRYKNFMFRLVCAVLIMILSITTIFSVLRDFQVIASDSSSNYYYHLLKQETEALAWLRQNSNQRDTILSNWFFGNLIPGMTGRKTYTGHRVQTPYFDTKIEKVNKFLLNKNSTQAYNFLKKNGITYIFLGKNDSMLRYGFKPFTKPYLIDVYNKGGVLIFKVK